MNYLKLVIKKSSDLIAITYCAKVFRICSRIGWNGKNISVASFEKLCIGALIFASMLTISSTAQASTTWDWTVVSGSTIHATDYDGADAFITAGIGGALDGLESAAIGYSDTGPSSTFELANMRSEWTGLGVCNVDELGDCVDFLSPENVHQVDNQGEHDWVLLVFGAGPLENYDFGISGLGYADLAGTGFGDRMDTSADYGEGFATIDFGGAVGNAILIGTKLGDTDDRLKIASIQASVVPAQAAALPGALPLLSFGSLTHGPYGPADRDASYWVGTISPSVIPVPAAVWLFGSGLGLLGWLGRGRIR